MNDAFLKQLFAELTSAQEVTLRTLCAALGDVTDKPAELAYRLEQRSASVLADRRHPTAERWLTAMVRELRGETPAKH